MLFNDDSHAAAAANTTTAMPLTYLTGDVDLNDLLANGNYISPGKVAQNHPPGQDSEAAWSVQVFATKVGNATYLTQAFMDTNGTWWRSSTNSGTKWSDWKRFSDELTPAMPLNSTPVHDLNQIKTDGFYHSTGTAVNGPVAASQWALMVISAPAENPSIITQVFYADNAIWQRASSNNGANWGAWKEQIASGVPAAYNADSILISGFYESNGTALPHAPNNDTEWTLLVISTSDHNSTYTSQFFYADSGAWLRSKKAKESWSNWKEIGLDIPPAMPFETLKSPEGGIDLDRQYYTGFYLGDGIAPKNPPGAAFDTRNQNAAWALQVIRHENSSSPHVYITQIFYSTLGIWWRKTENSAYNWSDWKGIVGDVPPSMPLNPAPINDLDEIKADGFYHSKGTAATHAPSNSPDWALLVVTAPASNPIYIAQTFYVGTEVWVRSKTNNAAWSAWKNVAADFPEIPPAMPLNATSVHDLNQIKTDGFYHSTGTAVNGPVSASQWALMVISAPADKPSTITQVFYADNTIWQRASSNNGSNWDAWREQVTAGLPSNYDVNNISVSGFYQSNGTALPHAPVTDTEWTLQVISSSEHKTAYTSQTFYAESRAWFRDKKATGSWSKWKEIGLDIPPAMPLKTLDSSNGLSRIDVDKQYYTGIYFGDGYPPYNGPKPTYDPDTPNGAWALQVMRFNYGNRVHIAQIFYSDIGIWWRRTQDSGYHWSPWANVVERDTGIPSYASAYLLGDAVIPNNHFVPFDQSGPNRALPFDQTTGEFVIAQAGTYSVTANLHLNSNQAASFAIAIDGETPEHHSALHYEPASSVLTGHFSATLTSIIACTEGQRVGIKNITGKSVTLWHAVTDRRSKHELILTQLDVHEEESE